MKNELSLQEAIEELKKEFIKDIKKHGRISLLFVFWLGMVSGVFVNWLDRLINK